MPQASMRILRIELRQTPDQVTARRAALLLGLAAVLLALLAAGTTAGVSRSYDWGLHAAWIERFYQAIVAGQRWPQWLADADGGRGAPVFVFYPPLAYWLAAAFRAASGDAVVALKLTESSAIASPRLFNRKRMRNLAAV